MFGLMPPLATYHQQKNGPLKKRGLGTYWKDKDTQLVHFIGKDNIVFHCIIFPSMLHVWCYILPDNVPANEFLNLEEIKFYLE